MSLLSVVQDVCAVVGVTRPVSVFAAIGSNRTMFEMVALANEMAQRIAYDGRDWQSLMTAISYDSTVAVSSFGTSTCPLPANFKRLLLTSNIRRSTAPNYHLAYISNPDEWLERRMTQWTGAWGEWSLFNEAVNIYPAIGTSETVNFLYADKNCVRLTSGGYGDRFQADTDTFRLDERLLKLGMIWQWKANKGSPYAEDMGTYQDAIMSIMGRDKPAPILVVGGMYAYR